MFAETISMHEVIYMEAGWEKKLCHQLDILYDNIISVYMFFTSHIWLTDHGGPFPGNFFIRITRLKLVKNKITF